MDEAESLTLKMSLVEQAAGVDAGAVVRSETEAVAEREGAARRSVALRVIDGDYVVHWHDESCGAGYFGGAYRRDPMEAVEIYLARCARIGVNPIRRERTA